MPRIKKFQLDIYLKKQKSKRLKKGTYDRFQIDSKYLKNRRTIDLYLPPSYRHTKKKNYPVLYMHDGNNLFYPEIAFGGWPWGVDKVLNQLLTYGLAEECIVVGVYNTMGRHNEYSWTPMSFNGQLEGGQGPEYARFLIEELKPVIDHKYRTLTTRENTAVIGSSMGGLISFYLGKHHSDTFSKIGVYSPSFWWNQGEPIRDAKNYPQNLKLWLDMGTREGNPKLPVSQNGNIQLVRACKEVLLQEGFKEGQNLAYLEDRRAYHTEYFWGRRIYLTLIYFFGKNQSLIWKP